MAGVVEITTDQFLGKKIDFLGSNQNVNLAVADNYPIFTTGTVINRAPSNKTYVAYCLIAPNEPRPGWDSGTCTFSFDATNWCFTQELGLYSQIPTVVYPRSNPAQSGPPVYPNNTIFYFNLAAGNSRNGVATVSAYGWAF